MADAQPFYDPAPVATAVAEGAAVVGKRLVSVAAARAGGHVSVAHATDGSAPIEGVAVRDAAEDEILPVALEGVWPVTCGEDITAGDPITAGAAGVAMIAAADEYAVGVAWDDASNGDDVPVKLSPFTVPSAP